MIRFSFVTLLLCGLTSSTASAEEMRYPVDVVAATDGTIYVADHNLPGIWKITDKGIETYFKASSKFRTPLNSVRCLAIDGKGRLLAGDSATRDVYRFNEPGKPTPLTNGAIGIPTGIAVRGNGEILVSDLELQCVWKVSADGGDPVKLAALPAPVGICLDKNEQLWVLSRSVFQLRRVSPDGKVVNVLEGRPFMFPHDLVIDDQQTVYVTDGYGKAVWKVLNGRKAEKLVEGDPLVNPVGIAKRGDELLVADPRSKAIFQVDKDGKVTKLTPN